METTILIPTPITEHSKNVWFSIGSIHLGKQRRDFGIAGMALPRRSSPTASEDPIPCALADLGIDSDTSGITKS